MNAARVAVRDLRMAYPSRRGPVEVLAGVSLHADGGEFVSIVGPSGSGKSTLFGLLTGLLVPTGGEILLDGHRPGGADRGLAWMPQADVLLPWRTVERNVALGLEVQGMRPRPARARARALLPTFGLAGFGDAHPHQLSGGMRQRAAFARTVAQGRDVLLLDEPFGALDALTRTELQLWLAGLWQAERWTVLLISHDIREAVLLSDRVYVLGHRPATVRAVIDIDLPRPRALADVLSAAGIDLERRILGALADGAPSAAEGGDSVGAAPFGQHDGGVVVWGGLPGGGIQEPPQ